MSRKMLEQTNVGGRRVGAAHPRRFKGFTLIELPRRHRHHRHSGGHCFCPPAAKAKTKAQGTQCRNNLHQLALAWVLYSSDSHDLLALNGSLGNIAMSMTDSDLNNGNWVHGVMGTADGSYESNTDPLLVEAGALWPYSRSLGISKCSRRHQRFSSRARSPASTTRSMSMNCWLNPIPVWSPLCRYYRKQADISNPGPCNLWVFLDECPNSINDGYFVCQPGTTSWEDIPASYHNGAGGLVYADGHSETKKWRDPTVLKLSPVGTAPAQTPPADLNWLQLRSSVKL